MRRPTWFPPARASGARLRLFCFPYAGGGAAVYRPWQAALPPEVELLPALLPAREARFGEPPLRRMEALVAELAAAMAPLLDLPYALFGHSLGAFTAYELSRLFRARGLPPPSRVFLSGAAAPHLLASESRDGYLLEDAAFLQRVVGYNGIPREVLDHPELLQLVLPVLRSDFEIYGTYHRASERLLEVPFTVLGGSEDVDIPRAALEAWAHYTTGPTEVRLFPGDHFFIQASREPVLETLRAALSALTTARP